MIVVMGLGEAEGCGRDRCGYRDEKDGKYTLFPLVFFLRATLLRVALLPHGEVRIKGCAFLISDGVGFQVGVEFAEGTPVEVPDFAAEN
jgi:hypothetical protein